MSGLTSIMDTSLSALFAAQAGLATTSHNIANADNRIYSRQQVMVSPRRPAIMPYGAIGRGVNIDGVRRVQDEFLATNLRNQAATLESHVAVDAALYEVESILGSVDNDHLGTAMTNFFNSWNALAQPSVNPDLKGNVVSTAESLVLDFHSMSDALDDLSANIELTIQGEIDNLNELLVGVGSLNEQIMRAESSGAIANDLRDQRDALVLGVSKLAEVSVIERDDGSKDLVMAGRTVVTRGSVTEFATLQRSSGGASVTSIVTADTHREVTLPEGKLAGLLASRDEHVSQVREQLDAVAVKLIREVNNLHTQGRTDMSSGLVFFTGDSMHTIEVNASLQANPQLIATGRTTAASDNDLALEIANLVNVSADGEDEITILDAYRTTINDTAGKRSSFDFLVQSQNNVVMALEAKMQSVSGVSLDEEGANMVKYQNSYNAAAKVITAVQEMYDVLLNMV
ncbi:MAG: flagellar hook-associated protein FlgK [bacterium]|nr:flagellar hook-associated protein FlgK [bacterium]